MLSVVADVELVGNRLHSRAVGKWVVSLLSIHLSMVLRRLSINPRLSQSRASLSYTILNRIKLWPLLFPLANLWILLRKLAAHAIRL